MGSIPILAEGIQQPQPPSMLGEMAKMQAIKNAQVENQLSQGALQLQQQQIKDQQAMSRAMQEWDGSDWNQVPMLIRKNGGSAQAIMGAANSILQRQQQLATLNKEQLETEAVKHDQLAGAINPALDPKQVPEADLPNWLRTNAKEWQQRGLIDPAHEQTAEALASLPPDQARLQLANFQKGWMGEKQQIENAAKAAEGAKNTAQAAESGAKQKEAEANTEKTQAETELLKKYGGASAAQQEARYLNIQMQQRRGQPVSPDDAAFVKAYEHMKTLVPVANFNLQNAGGQSSPTDPLVQAVANGSMKIGDVITYRTPLALRKEFLQNVMKANPNFNSANYDIEKGVMRDFTSGTSAKNLTAFNTAIEHANQLQQAADALNNGDVRGLNKIGNALGYQFGSDKTTNFNVIKNALSGEVSKVFKGGQATDAEIREVQQPFDSANSPAQLKGAIQNAIRLMNSKRDALKQQYEAGRQGQPNFGGSQPSQAGGFDWNSFQKH